MRQKEKISNYIALLNIIHSTDPNRLAARFNALLDPGGASSDEVLDIGDIERLKLMKKEAFSAHG